jgi:hypothetical protein
LKNRQSNRLVFLVQGVGAVFVCFFLGAYFFSLPSDGVLHSEPFFRIPLQIFSGVFLVLILVVAIFSLLRKSKSD